MNEYMSNINFRITEGSISHNQSRFLEGFIKSKQCKKIMEIGFNGGISSAIMLSSDQDIHVVSFDLGEHDYVHSAKILIDKMFPGRHTLILGDSRLTVPEYNNELFDMIFVDGGHEGDIPEKDIKNVLRLLKDDGFIIVDDYCEAYGRDVMKAVKKCTDEGVVKISHGPYFSDGDRGWIVLVKN